MNEMEGSSRGRDDHLPRGVLPQTNERSHVFVREATCARLQKSLLRERAEQQRRAGGLSLIVNQPQVLQDQTDGRRWRKVTIDEARKVAAEHGGRAKGCADQVEDDLRVRSELGAKHG